MKRDDGGPAFPRPASPPPATGLEWAEDGMTLRDWFAGQVLAGISTSYADQQDEAAWAYSVADAMLAERAKERTVDLPAGAATFDPAMLGRFERENAEVERGQAPDEPAAEGRTDHAASPAPASVPHCLNCGLVLDSARDYCLVCGCEAWLFSQRESDIKCTLRAGHDGDHLNGAVSWGGSS